MPIHILVALTIGFLFGYKKWVSDKMIQINTKLQLVWLLLLIFSMGMSIGSSKEIIFQLPSLGGKALLFAIASIAGSVLCVYFFSFFLEKEEKE